MSPSNSLNLVAVTGDPTLDWGVLLPDHRCPTVEERLTSAATTHWHWGGAIGLYELMRCVVPEPDRVRSQEWSKPADYPSGGDLRFHHSYNTLQFLPLSDDKKGGKPETDRKVRVREFLGFHVQEKLQPLTQPKLKSGQSLSLLLLDDAGFGFGENGELCRSTNELARRGDPWILVKLGTRALEGNSELWRSLSQSPDVHDHVIPIVTAPSLREIGAAVSRGLSWERSAQDVLAELELGERDEKSALSDLAKHKRLIVSFGPSGVLIIDHTSRQSRHQLFFHREFTEATWGKHDHGGMFGYTQALTAAIGSSLLKRVDSGSKRSVSTALAEGTRNGLVAMRALYDLGFEANSGFDKAEGRRQPGEMHFPLECMIEGTDSKEKYLEELEVTQVPEPRSGSELPTWSSLASFAAEPSESLEDKAVQVAIRGCGQLKGVPIAHFHDLITADWHEIEGLRVVQNLIAEYINSPEKKKPRSIGVFGRPGDGKSFAVREVVASLYPNRDKGLTFNLSQFQSVADLANALHQVRDRGLQGEAPLVFWDEFDSNFREAQLGWLSYFLSPMQDGTFQQGEIVHPIGRAIFVFAGGTCHRYDQFIKMAKGVDANSKAADFASRLQGYLDVVGPNPGKNRNKEKAAWMFHRALLLNHFLNDAGIGKEAGKLDVDMGVVRAFLRVEKYYHGARSMQTVVDISRLHRGGRFGRASLPHMTLLNLHVNAEEFLSIVREVPPNGA
ncbi:hypothetical protein [Streptomyces sp. NBC_00576]|uniref:hypothetical protein n=1 Tax=Streptomyces sp. NBC_00576 TaxID=2903665 RepID=UPI002E81E2ED|nr:hypothetical protein [Streptomyces sp. NBC_00576]WUB73081.1 hypothetical protein OG734_24990 [Streptomyces sp. NBC_00576]